LTVETYTSLLKGNRKRKLWNDQSTRHSRRLWDDIHWYVGSTKSYLRCTLLIPLAGVAWQVVPYNQINVDLEDVKLQKLWPGDKPGDKVPSVISYSPTAEHNYNWGFDITGQSLRWTKLQLDQASRKQELQWILDALIGMKNLDMDQVRMEHGLPTYPAKDPVDIVTDYLIKLRAHIKEKIIEKMTDRRTFEEMPKEIVITVPAVSTTWCIASQYQTNIS
jgi:hypothetical protein